MFPLTEVPSGGSIVRVTAASSMTLLYRSMTSHVAIVAPPASIDSGASARSMFYGSAGITISSPVKVADALSKVASTVTA